MLKSVGPDPATKVPTIVSRCGLRQTHRAASPFPAEFTGWECEVTCGACAL